MSYNPNALLAPEYVPVSNVGLNWPIVSPLWYGAKGDGTTDDTAAFTAWLAAIAGKTGYIPVSPSGSAYYLPSGLTISGHQYTKIISDRSALMNNGTQVSGYFITMTNCLQCDFDFPQVQAGYSGLLIQSTAAFPIRNKVYFERLVCETALSGSKPSDPMANTVGINVLGPTVGDANYYNYIKPGTSVAGFDTAVAFYTPDSVSAMNSNGNLADGVLMFNYWFGFYTNSVENQFINAQWFDTTAGSAGNNAECVRIGDGTYQSAYNRVTGAAEPASTYAQAVFCQTGTFDNKILIQDNVGQSSVDAGSNDITLKNSAVINSQTTIKSLNSSGTGTQSCLTATATTLFTIPNTAGSGGTYLVSLWFSGGGGTYVSQALICQSGDASSAAALVQTANGGSGTITLSGQDVQVTQSSGSTLTCHFSYLFVNTP